MHFRIIPAITILILMSGQDQIQTHIYIYKESQDNVTISYKWKRYGLFKKDKPIRLVLRIENDNPYRIQVNFSVDYYWRAVRRASSEKADYCIKPNGRIKGKIWNLAFDTGPFSENEILDARFMWDISDFSIQHEADCKPRLNRRNKSNTNKIGNTQNSAL